MPNKLIQKLKSLFQNPINDEFVEKSEAFCMMPWVHLHVSQTGTVIPCCQAPWDKELAFGDINEQSVEEIWNGEAIREFRQKMMRDEKDSRCERCYVKEKVGLLSMRGITNRVYQHKMDWVQSTKKNGYAPDSKPIYWDLRFTNLCNFRCRICGPWSSSRWYEDGKAMNMVHPDAPKVTHGIQDYEGLMAQLEPNILELEEIYFAGGEPLIMDEHYRILDLLIEKGHTDITLRYNTNFSILAYKGRSVLDLWKHFDKVMIAASLDGSGKKGEFQRKDQDWQKTVANLKRVKAECENVHFLISATLSVFNIFHLPNFHKEWVEAGYIDVKDCWPSMLEQPEHYNIRILPVHLKEKAAQLYREHIEWIRSQPTNDEYARDMVAKEYQHCINYLLSEDWSERIPQFVAVSRKLDELRNESTEETFPELAELFTQ